MTLEKFFKAGRKQRTKSPDLFVQYVASTFIQVLNWWMESRNPLPAKEVNNVFRALILLALAATGD